MHIRKEMPSKNNISQHIFILENKDSEIWYNCFLTDIPDFALVCDVALDDLGNAETADFVGKYVDIFIQDKEYKGKMYPNITDYKVTSPHQITESAEVPDMGSLEF